MRSLAILAVAFLLSGCALPPAIVIASYAIDAGSYVISGKTLTDHGLSVVTGQDCHLIGILEGKVCENVHSYEVAQATLTPLEGNGPVLNALPSSASRGLLADGIGPQLASETPIDSDAVASVYLTDGVLLAEPSQLADFQGYLADQPRLERTPASLAQVAESGPQL